MDEKEMIREINCIRAEFVDVAEELCKNPKIDPAGVLSKTAKRIIEDMDGMAKALRANVSRKEGF